MWLHKLTMLALLLSLNLNHIMADEQYGSAVDIMLELMARGQRQADLEAQDDNVKLQSTYDFIVVGAGTAGCALAARLSENENWSVLLIEAGGPESYIMDMPISVHYLQLGEMNWKYRAQPSKNYCLAMNDNRCNWPRGKVMGGSSVLNYLMYTRGNRRDYDNWAALGNKGWSYADVLPYFKKYEQSDVADAEPGYVGREGPVKISYIKYRTRIADAFVRAAQQDGLKYRDYNGHAQVGVSYLQTNTRNATRWSSNRAYLYPIKNERSNLHVLKNTLVTQLLINERTKATEGVIGSRLGKSFKLLAKREVILTAGAINTPQLMMLSGIGPAKHLREMGIKPLVDLAVGYNLQDHIAPALTFTTNATSLHMEDIVTTENLREFLHGGGPFGLPGGVETIAFWALDDSKKGLSSEQSWPDIEMFMVSGGLHTNGALRRAFGIKQEIHDALFADMEAKNADAFMIFPMILRPKSRGRIMLKSSDPFKYPLIYANYFANDYDLDIAVRGIQKALSLIQQPAYKAINAQPLNRTLPACQRFGIDTRAYWACYARHITLTIYHYAGTAKMGPKTDHNAVVDERLNVYGIKKLRVADASIMPELIAGHPNGPVFMIAEKAADMIKEDHFYTA